MNFMVRNWWLGLMLIILGLLINAVSLVCPIVGGCYHKPAFMQYVVYVLFVIGLLYVVLSVLFKVIKK